MPGLVVVLIRNGKEHSTIVGHGREAEGIMDQVEKLAGIVRNGGEGGILVNFGGILESPAGWKIGWHFAILRVKNQKNAIFGVGDGLFEFQS